MIKTYENWKGSLSEYLQVGDQVDESMYSHFINVLPPATFRSNLVQIGEAYSISKENKNTYPTLERINGNWIYRGNCHRGDNNPQESLY